MPTVGGLAGYQPWNEGLPYPPGPYAWPAGESWPINGDSQVNGQDLNEQLSLPVNFLAAKPFFQGTQFTVQSIPNGTVTNITWDTEFADAWGMHGNVLDNSQIIIPIDCDGYYLVENNMAFYNATATAVWRPICKKNGAVYSQGESLGWASTAAGVSPGPNYMDIVPLNANDVIQMAVYQSTGGTIATVAGSPAAPWNQANYCAVTVRWVGALSGVAGLPAPNISSYFRNPVASADFNNYITDPVLMLSYPPICRVYQTVATSVPASTFTLITGMTVSFDNTSAYNTSTSTWTCPLSGVYLLHAQVGWPTESSSYQGTASLYVTSGGSANNLVSTRAGETTQPIGSTTRKLRLNRGDTVQVQGFQSSGSTISTEGATNPGDTRFTALWISR